MVVGGAAQQPADPVERVLAAAAVPEVLALDAAAHIVDGGESEAHHVEGVQDPHGVWQRGGACQMVCVTRSS